MREFTTTDVILKYSQVWHWMNCNDCRFTEEDQEKSVTIVCNELEKEIALEQLKQ